MLDKTKQNLEQLKELLTKKAPKDFSEADKAKHESCVLDVKDEGKSVGSAHAICTAAMRKEEDDDGQHHPVAHIYKRRTGEHVLSHSEPSAVHLRSWLLSQGYDDKGGDKWYNHMHDHYVNWGTVNSKDRNAMVAGNFKAPPAKAYPSDDDLPEHVHLPGIKPHLVKSEGEVLKTNANGQWSLEKSNYGPKGAGLYSPTDNIKRKETRTGEVQPDVGQNVGVRAYTTSGSSVQAAHEAAQNKEQKKKSKSSVKIFTDEEKRALEEKMKQNG